MEQLCRKCHFEKAFERAVPKKNIKRFSEEEDAMVASVALDWNGRWADAQEMFENRSTISLRVHWTKVLLPRLGKDPVGKAERTLWKSRAGARAREKVRKAMESEEERKATPWNAEADGRLLAMEGSPWVDVAEFVGDRTAEACRMRHQRVWKPETSHWTRKDVARLVPFVEAGKVPNWQQLSVELRKTEERLKAEYVKLGGVLPA
jgi:hypothetical protein